MVLALLGVNVIIVLIGGTLLAGIIGLIDGSFGWMGLLDAVSKGIISMEDIAMIALLIGGLVGIIQHNGGIEWLLQFVRSKVKSKRGAELGIASLVSVAILRQITPSLLLCQVLWLKILQMNMM